MSDEPRRYDVVVLGSGAAGSVAAYRLARAGLRVAVLERGKRENPRTFSHNEYEMLPRVYRAAGTQTTVDNAISILQGQTVGGSTVINNAIWLRPDLDRILPDWAARGAHLDRARLTAAYEDLERSLGVVPIPPTLMNAGTGLFVQGCQKLGIESVNLSHNRTDCIGCGFCNYGCRYDRKASMLVTFIPWAESRGAHVYDQAEHARLVRRGDGIAHVEFTRFGKPYAIEGNAFVVSCGAIGSSEVLLQSGIHLDGRVGNGFHLLGGALMVAESQERIDAFDKIGLTYMAKASPDYVIESFFSPPAAFAVSLNGFSSAHAQRMQRYAYLAQAGAMVGLEPKGTIKLDDGVAEIHCQPSPADLDKLRRGMVRVAEIYLAGGAKAVYPGTHAEMTITSSSDLQPMTQAIRSAADVIFGSAHPQGGNPMCNDPKRGVVGLDFRVHGMKNLYVADTSVFPSNLWANCQATAMAMGYLAADSILRGAAGTAG